MNAFWNWWNSLNPELRDGIIAGVIALISAGIIIAFVKLSNSAFSRLFTKPFNSTQPSASPVTVEVRLPATAAPAEATQPAPRLALLPTIPRPPVVGFIARRDMQGRDILEVLKEELAPEKGRLVGLYGAGGVGKTTLAAEAARALSEAFKHRVVWVSADGRLDFALSTLLDEIAAQLGHTELRPLPPDQKSEQVRALVMEAPTLVVLDNFETIFTEVQMHCADWFSRTRCSALITSRIVVPQARAIQIQAMPQSEAMEFLDRAIKQSRNPRAFDSLDYDRIINASDRNPLVMLWVIKQIDRAKRPRAVLRELEQGKGDAVERVFNRSFDLLEEDGRAVLLALSLFTPSASREALTEVVGFDADVERLDKAIGQLAELWLIGLTEGNERLSVEGVTRVLAHVRLVESQHAEQFRLRFVAYFMAYAEARKQPTPEDFDALEAEKDNLLGAMDVAFRLKLADSMLRIYSALAYFLDIRGYWDEAIRIGEQAITMASLANDEMPVAQFAANTATIRARRGEFDAAKLAYSQALDVFKKLGSEANVANVLHNLAVIEQEQGELGQARRLYDESLEIESKLGDERGIARTLRQLGAIAQEQGDLSQARRLYDESLEIRKKLGEQSGIAGTLHQLATLAQELGEFDEARRLYDESLEIRRRLGDQSGIASTFYQLGTLAQGRGDYEEARRLFEESLYIRRKLGDERWTFATLRQMGRLYREDEPRRALEYLIQAHLSSANQASPLDEEEILSDIAALQEAVGDAPFETILEKYSGAVESAPDRFERLLLDQDYRRAEHLMQKGQWKEAGKILKRLKEQYKKLESRMGFAKTLLALAQIEESIGDLEKARWTYKDALAQFEGFDDRYRAITCVYLGRLEVQTNLVEDGVAHLKEARDYFAHVKDDNNLEKVSQLLEAAEQLAS